MNSQIDLPVFYYPKAETISDENNSNFVFWKNATKKKYKHVKHMQYKTYTNTYCNKKCNKKFTIFKMYFYKTYLFLTK